MSSLDAQGLARLDALIAATRWGALATVNADGTPLASQVACAIAEGALILHLSTLAVHTRNLLARPACALSLSEVDDGRADPQTLARVALRGQAQVVAPSEGHYQRWRDLYLGRFPQAEPRFDFGDFHLFRVPLSSGQFVGGFAAAHKLAATQLAQLGCS